MYALTAPMGQQHTITIIVIKYKLKLIYPICNPKEKQLFTGIAFWSLLNAK